MKIEKQIEIIQALIKDAEQLPANWIDGQDDSIYEGKELVRYLSSIERGKDSPIIDRREELRGILRGKCVTDKACESAIDDILNMQD